MAKRGKGKGKSTKPAGRPARGGGVQVENPEGGEAEAGSKMGLEQALVLVTFVALVTALILSQIELGSSFGRGLF